MEHGQKHNLINVGSALDVGEAITNPVIVIIKVLNIISSTRLDTCQVCIDPLQQTQARETVNMFDGLSYRTLTLTVPFFKFQGNLLTRLQWN